MSDIRTVEEWLRSITAELHDAAERPRREAELLLMEHLQCDQLWIMMHAQERVENPRRLIEWIQRRKAHEPFEYIVNRVSFYSQMFYIAPGALIPRPETEILIDTVLENVDREAEITLAEVGVGSGVISIILAQQLPHAKIIATDISDDALKVARKNIEAFGLEERISLRKGSLLDAVEEKIDLLVSNPPYIANAVPLEKNLDYEPDTALFGGTVGDEIIQELIGEVLKRKIPCFTCEMGYDQKEKVEGFVSSFSLQSLQFYKDLAGFDRGFTLKI